MQDYKKLKIWKRSFKLTKRVYEVTKPFPKSENYGLKSQIRRAVVSVPANIAEGASRQTNKDFKRYLTQSYASLKEVECLLLLSRELGYLRLKDLKALEQELLEISKMIYRFIGVL